MSKQAKTEKLTVPVLPLREVIVFPHMVVPLFVGREKSIHALEECVEKKKELFLVAQKAATTVNPGEKDIFQIGTLGTILQILRLPDNTVKVLIEGKRRAKMLKFSDGEAMIEADVEVVVEASEKGVESEALVR
jgi:ATP-dependent Lon protease